MEDYWNQQVEESNSTGRIPTSSQVSNKHPLESEYDRHRRQLLQSQAIHANSGGWGEELQRYLHDMPTNVTKDTDIVAWWAVSTFISIFCCYIYLSFYRNILKSIQLLPTLLWIFVQFQQHLFPASGSFQQVLKLPQIDDHALV
jgi:hypothetical protein